MRRPTVPFLPVLLGLALWIPAAGAGAQELAFELRVYTAEEGKLEDLQRRFREHTVRLFEKHGMTVVAFWTPTDEERAKDTLIYVLSYPSAEARQESWRAFASDPEWQRVYQESHANGPLVAKVESTMMTPTDYSPMR
ncbi:MAG TPA: NIPSNAP family protein [Thermoanaerobaculia bacterium]|nr:NIPSNAP family protein [Thermoanaerobaculia bacterium]